PGAWRWISARCLSRRPWPASSTSPANPATASAPSCSMMFWPAVLRRRPVPLACHVSLSLPASAAFRVINKEVAMNPTDAAGSTVNTVDSATNLASFTADAAQTAVAATGPDLSALGLFMHADTVGKLVIIALVLASVICWAIVIEKVVLFTRLGKQVKQLVSAAAPGAGPAAAATP